VAGISPAITFRANAGSPPEHHVRRTVATNYIQGIDHASRQGSS
jgi:hypothetical protein